MEENYINTVQSVLDSPDSLFQGKLYFLKKRMRLKSGKEYFEPFFPGYVFLQTEETDCAKLRMLAKYSGFLRYLPSTKDIKPLVSTDLEIITSMLNYGTTIEIVPVMFDENDRIIILDGPFKNIPGKIIAVNRRNKRVNIQLDFMSGLRVVGLTYEEIKKM